MEESQKDRNHFEETRSTEPTDVDMASAHDQLQTSQSNHREQQTGGKKKRIRLRIRLARLRRRKGVTMGDEGTLFGRSVDGLYDGEALNPQLMWLLRILHEHGPSAEGIFRRSSNANICRTVKSQMDNGTECSQVNVYVASNLLKELLRSLPDCLLCCDRYDQWLECEQNKSHLQRMVNELPWCNLRLLRFVICVLHGIHLNSNLTKMTSNNLAVCFGPTLLWSKTASLDKQKADVGRVVTVIQSMIENAESIFGADCLQLFQGLTATDHDEKTDTEELIQSAASCTETAGDFPDSGPGIGSSPHPVAPPRRKRSMVTTPTVPLLSTRESSVCSLADLSNDQGNKDLDRSQSMESEFSGSETRNYTMDSTDIDALEDSASYEETSVTEEELEDRANRSSMLSANLADEEDNLAQSPSGDKKVLEIDRNPEISDTNSYGASEESTKTYRRDLMNIHQIDKTSKSLKQPVDNSIDRSSSKNAQLDLIDGTHLGPSRSRVPRETNSSYDTQHSGSVVTSFSSTDEILDELFKIRQKRQFFGSSFSSTAGSDADLSTFGESMDGGSAFVAPNCSSGNTKFTRSDRLNQSASSISMYSADHNIQSAAGIESRDQTTAPFNAKQRTNHNQNTDLVSALEGRRQQNNPAITVTAVDDLRSRDHTRDSGQSSTTTGGIEVTDLRREMNKNEEEEQQQVHPATWSRNRCVDGKQLTRQRRGMTRKGSDVFPAQLSNTYLLRNLRSSREWDYDSASGTESGIDAEAAGKTTSLRTLLPRGRALLDDRVVESDLERTLDYGSSVDQPGSFDVRQWDSDTGEFHVRNREYVGRNRLGRYMHLTPYHGSEITQSVPDESSELNLDLTATKQDDSEDLEKTDSQITPAETRLENDKPIGSACSEDKSKTIKVTGDFSTTHNPTSGRKISAVERLSASDLRPVRSYGSITDANFPKRYFTPRTRRASAVGNSNSSSNSSAEDENQHLRNEEDNQRRKRRRRSRRTRISDTRLQTQRKNRVNLVRSKSDSNTVVRTQLIIRNRSNEHCTDAQRTKFLLSKDLAHFGSDTLGNQRKISGKDSSTFKTRDSFATTGTQNKENDRNLLEMLSKIPPISRKPVTMKNRDWHKELVQEVVSSGENLLRNHREVKLRSKSVPRKTDNSSENKLSLARPSNVLLYKPGDYSMEDQIPKMRVYCESDFESRTNNFESSGEEVPYKGATKTNFLQILKSEINDNAKNIEMDFSLRKANKTIGKSVDHLNASSNRFSKSDFTDELDCIPPGRVSSLNNSRNVPANKNNEPRRSLDRSNSLRAPESNQHLKIHNPLTPEVIRRTPSSQKPDKQTGHSQAKNSAKIVKCSGETTQQRTTTDTRTIPWLRTQPEEVVNRRTSGHSSETKPRGVPLTQIKPSPFASSRSIDKPNENQRSSHTLPTDNSSSRVNRVPTRSDVEDGSDLEGRNSGISKSEKQSSNPGSRGHRRSSDMPWSVANMRRAFDDQNCN